MHRQKRRRVAQNGSLSPVANKAAKYQLRQSSTWMGEVADASLPTDLFRIPWVGFVVGMLYVVSRDVRCSYPRVALSFFADFDVAPITPPPDAGRCTTLHDAISNFHVTELGMILPDDQSPRHPAKADYHGDPVVLQNLDCGRALQEQTSRFPAL